MRQMRCEKSRRANCVFPLFYKKMIRHIVKIFISNPKDGVKEFVCIAIAVTGLGSCSGLGISKLPGLGATFIPSCLPAGHRITNDGNLLRLHCDF